MTAIPVHVALVDDTQQIDPMLLAQVAGALNQQVQADFAPAWKVAATVGAYPTAPTGTWTVHLTDRMDDPSALGYHTDDHRQPYAMVDATDNDWPITASHEVLEMLADPFGSRLHAAAAPEGWGGYGLRVHYLLEVADPCEASTYETGGVAVSDFILPAYYRTAARKGATYSHTGAIAYPRAVNPGGYVSFVDLGGGWWQRFVDDHGRVSDQQLGPFDGSSSLREWTDLHANRRRGDA